MTVPQRSLYGVFLTMGAYSDTRIAILSVRSTKAAADQEVADLTERFARIRQAVIDADLDGHWEVWPGIELSGYAIRSNFGPVEFFAAEVPGRIG